jgi:hypothetical protein
MVTESRSEAVSGDSSEGQKVTTTRFYEFEKMQQTLHLKQAHFILSKLYVDKVN